MARKINSRLKISGTLQAETPLHVGGYGADVDTDLPLARNGKNQLYIPGTSITGVLRTWCEKNFKEDVIGEIFGPKREKGVEKGHASFVLIEDVKVIDAKNVLTEIRDGVGIDRFYGTAAEGAKYDRAILPKGTKLEFEMIVEISEKHNPAETKAIFGHLLEALQNQEIRFGASKTRGLGKVKLTKLHKIQIQDFNDILSWITLDGKGEEITDKDKIKAEIATLSLGRISKNDSPKLEIEICWHPTLPLMNKAGYEGIGVDMLPVTSGDKDGKLSLVLAGSSIKGAFRSQAERIIRTLLDIETPNKSDDSQNFSNQIRLLDKNGKNTETATKLIGQMFGAKKEKDKPSQLKSKLGLGALSIDDCYSVESFDQTNWRNVEQGNAKDDISSAQWEITTALNAVHNEMTHQTKLPNPHFHISHHTAIDRFTGGVAEGALYSVLAPHNIEWQPIKMSLDFSRTENEKCCLMLLLLVLRDLAENRLPLGFATNRGMGEVEIEKIEIKGTYNIVWENGQFFFADENQKIIIGKDWQEFIKSFQNQLVSENVGENMPEKLKQDLESNWNETIENLNEKTEEKILLHQDTEQNRFHKSEKKQLSENKLTPEEIIARSSEITPQYLEDDIYKLVGRIYANRYQLVQFADEGGMGAVYRANDLLLEKQVAVKIIRPGELKKHPKLRELFDREVEAASKLSHPNIVGITDWGDTGHNNSFFVMEWLEGIPLDRIIFNERLSIERIRNIFRQICLGVAFAHSQKVLHLDIKPQNLVVFSDDYVRVVDFGLARMIKDASESGILVNYFAGGDTKYCSPEHFGGKLTSRSDIYCLGITLFELITGLVPIGQSAILAKQFPHWEIPPLPKLAHKNPNFDAVDAVIEKAIRRNPEERHQSVEELLKDFELALSKMKVNEGEKQNEQE